jgi:hypothetical protein
MANVRFEKFEMKYGYYLPEDFKRFMIKFGGDAQFGSCRFEYPENIINNILRVPSKMDFHLFPFGDVGNGDYYCFYKYGEDVEEYFIGIWLHETNNFAILTSSFRGFLYKCILDDYLTTILPGDDLTEMENVLFSKECLERSERLAAEYEFDFEKIKTLENELDYHEFMAEFDEGAIQSLCYIGNKLLKSKDKRAYEILDKARKIYRPYTAPNYLLGKAMLNMGKDGNEFFKQALNGSLVLTGYSYWEEDYLEIPEDVHREIVLYADSSLTDSGSLLERKLYNGEDPYSFELRLELARNYIKENDNSMAMVEYNNAIFCCSSKTRIKEILKEALDMANRAGFSYLTGILEQDIRKIR